MIQPPARLGEGESAGRRPGGSAAEAGFARLPPFGRAACGPIPPPHKLEKSRQSKMNPLSARGEKLSH